MMKKLIPEYIKNLEPYKAGKSIDELAREIPLKSIAKLASNENPLGASPLAVKELKKALSDIHRYPDMYATELKNLLAKSYKLKPENIILGSGSESILASITRTFLWPDEEILTSEDTFIGFYITARVTGAKIRMTPLTEDFKFDVKALAKKINKRTRIIYLANPNNPTGTYINREEFGFLMKHIPQNILVILDEAYFEFAQHVKDFPDSMTYRYDNVITLRTFSKAYGLAGLRIGYGFAHEDLIREVNKVKLPFEPNLLAQRAAIGALQDKNHLSNTLKNNLKQYKKTFSFLDDMNFSPIPSVTNFILFDPGSKDNCDYFFNHLLQRGIITRPIISPALPHHLRISLGTESEMKQFFQSMKLLNKRKPNGRKF